MPSARLFSVKLQNMLTEAVVLVSWPMLSEDSR